MHLLRIPTIVKGYRTRDRDSPGPKIITSRDVVFNAWKDKNTSAKPNSPLGKPKRTSTEVEQVVINEDHEQGEGKYQDPKNHQHSQHDLDPDQNQ